jgi:hypothetical protein
MARRRLLPVAQKELKGVSTRRTIRRAREQLGRLEAFAGLLERVTDRGEEPGGVIELEEVAPGVYASRPPKRAGLAGLLDQVEHIEERVRAIGRGRP